VSSTFLLGGELEVRRLGFGAMRIVADADEGKRVLLIGLSNVSVGQPRAAQSVARVVSVQNQFNRGLLTSDDVLAACEAEQTAFMPWAPLGEGLGDPAAELQWLLDRSPVMLPIHGTSKVKHLEANMRAADQ
jgi:pyridoxine 4-dehydrogenase